MRKETYLGHFHLSLSLSFNKLGTLFFIFHLFFLAPVHMKIYIYKPIDLEMERDGIFFLFFFWGWLGLHSVGMGSFSFPLYFLSFSCVSFVFTWREESLFCVWCAIFFFIFLLSSEPLVLWGVSARCIPISYFILLLNEL